MHQKIYLQKNFLLIDGSVKSLLPKDTENITLELLQLLY